MTAFRPISPHAALQILDAAGIGVDRHRLLADLAMAGNVKGYARLIETEVVGQPYLEVRDARIDRTIWRRIISEGRIGAVFEVGSVHLGDGVTSDRVSIIGIRFDARSVNAAAADHGAVIAPPPAVRRSKTSTPKLQMPLAPADSEIAATEPPPSVVVEQRRVTLEPGTVSLSIKDTAAVLGISSGTVRKLVTQGSLTAKKIGTRNLVQAESVRAYMA